MKSTIQSSLAAAAFILVSIWGCGNGKKNADNNVLKVGVESGPEYVVALTAQQVAKEQFGLDVELVQFNDYVMPNEALHQGDIDVNVFQNRPYLDVQAKQRGYKFAIQGNTFVFPLAGYSHKIKSVKELKDGSTIVIPNDPTNLGRALLLLQASGLLKLNPASGLLPNATDIVSNPKNLKILELEAPQLPRALDDKQVTIAIINNTFATPAGLVANRDGLFMEGKESPYVNIIVSREDNKTDEKIGKFVKAYQSKEVEKVAEQEFKGGAVKGW
ncbi:methionine ABC transporter substrate-binding lipoprotein MetQ [Pedobacter antarcticus]|uniref:Lipoprotein n=2 Tax=Pedobacter antarcticus TaxID=34086 RepID=A0A081PBJ0_9SPHI|nr:methionine ABC transporter substrate-binding lipoprotein MetQ [Pedobacter antarcticus]KEQ28063.1 DL-methionine transporter substrate-binding subunit [Pedobacter antarcticus 4BY]SDL44155.1 D-methionine transport system substrate-binding protein [Pedobacter antarcticus]SFE40573.1 D-methionine transport system substrate-binding protein [Pedobacter antarcticus]